MDAILDRGAQALVGLVKACDGSADVGRPDALPGLYAQDDLARGRHWHAHGRLSRFRTRRSRSSTPSLEGADVIENRLARLAEIAEAAAEDELVQSCPVESRQV